MTREQNSSVESVQSSKTAGAIGAGAGTAIVVSVLAFFFIMLVGGLFGYLLVMKNRILQWNTCGAVIAAS